jgi:hypothetical protein
VKRLANSYGLLKALQATGSGAELLAVREGDDSPGYRPAMVLLAMVIGFPMLGPALFPDLHRTARGETQIPWPEYVTRLRPQQTQHGLISKADGAITVPRAQHWTTMLDAVADIEKKATSASLPFAARIDQWARWVVPVGRLSFPTGSAVSRLIEPD